VICNWKVSHALQKVPVQTMVLPFTLQVEYMNYACPCCRLVIRYSKTLYTAKLHIQSRVPACGTNQHAPLLQT
jgi:hypothetical protein